MAAHLHDSVLQTLALVQKRADDPREVAALARRQERELRAWLGRRARRRATTRLGAPRSRRPPPRSRRRTACRSRSSRSATRRSTTRGEALVAAAREAMVNAAKFGARLDRSTSTPRRRDERVEVFVRDRGPGFDPDAVPADRRGVRESIVGRMERHGGRAAHPLGARARAPRSS